MFAEVVAFRRCPLSNVPLYFSGVIGHTVCTVCDNHDMLNSLSL